MSHEIRKIEQQTFGDFPFVATEVQCSETTSISALII